MSTKAHSATCVNCGVEVVRKPSFWKRIKGLACCSKKCRAEYLKSAYLGNSNPNYAAGTTLARWFHGKTRQIQHSAAQRGLSCTITPEELQQVYELQNGLCWYTGIPLQLASTESWKQKGQADMDVFSVDRVDSHQGYTRENIVLCCMAINRMKGSASLESTRDFLSYVSAKSTNVCRLRVKALRDNARIPSKSHLGDVGYDLSVSTIEDLGDRLRIGTGIAAQPEIGWFFEVYSRSSLQKQNLMLMNSVGIVDQSYTGEITLMLWKTKPEATVAVGDRVAQLIPRRYAMVDVQRVAELGETARGTGAFGSTGVSDKPHPSLVSLTPEELAKIPPLKDEDIQEALDKGKRDAGACVRRGVLPIKSDK